MDDGEQGEDDEYSEDDEAEDTEGTSSYNRWRLPSLSVRGVGPVPLPLRRESAAALLSAGSPAPYGHGLSTVLDPEVRRSTQLDAAEVELDAGWREEELAGIVKDACTALGVRSPSSVRAHLYKLLLYEPGGHFRPHRDTEKEPGMFGTLVVQLPVAGGHKGGKLKVGHRGDKRVWRTAAGSQEATLQCAAFYADCEHELRPVKSGLRMVLVYNLIWVGPETQPQPPPGKAVAAKALAEAARAWKAAASTGRHALRAIPLEHKYTETNLSFGRLKGRDAELVGLLCGCEELEVHLALVTKEVVGSVAGHCPWERSRRRRRRRYWSDWSDDERCSSDYESGTDAVMDQVLADTVSAKLWLSPSGHRKEGLKRLDDRLDLGQCLLGGDQLFRDEPDTREYEGYTGNAGPELTYWYHRAVAVIWPRGRTTAPLEAAGMRVLLDELDQLGRAPYGGGGACGPRGGGGAGFGNVSVSVGQTVAAPLPGQAAAVVAAQPEDKAARKPEDKAARKLGKLVEAVLRLAEQPRSAPARDRWRAEEPPERSLRALTSPPVLAWEGEAKRGASAARLVSALGLASSTLIMAIAAAASALSAPAFDDALVALVARQAVSQTERCVQLATEAAAPEELRGRLARTLMCRLLGGSGSPCSNGFAALKLDQVVTLSKYVFAGSADFRAHLQAFCAAVLARSDRQALLSALLREAAVAEAVRAQEPHPTRLAEARVAELEAAVARGRPVPSWEQPAARFPSDPEIEAFLRGPKQQEFFRGRWAGRPAGRAWAAQHFGAPYRTAGSGYCATAQADGCGRNTVVTITKINRQYDDAVRLYDDRKRELAVVRALLPSPPPPPPLQQQLQQPHPPSAPQAGVTRAAAAQPAVTGASLPPPAAPAAAAGMGGVKAGAAAAALGHQGAPFAALAAAQSTAAAGAQLTTAVAAPAAGALSAEARAAAAAVLQALIAQQAQAAGSAAPGRPPGALGLGPLAGLAPELANLLAASLATQPLQHMQLALMAAAGPSASRGSGQQVAAAPPASAAAAATGGAGRPVAALRATAQLPFPRLGVAKASGSSGAGGPQAVASAAATGATAAAMGAAAMAGGALAHGGGGALAAPPTAGLGPVLAALLAGVRWGRREETLDSEDEDELDAAQPGEADDDAMMPSTSGQGQALSLTSGSPSCSFLFPSRSFSGKQRLSGPYRQQEDWSVTATIYSYDVGRGTLSGSMVAQNGPQSKRPIVTYFEGEIVDNANFTFWTGSKWGAAPSRETDVRYWSRCPGFTSGLRSALLAHDGRAPQLGGCRHVFMRWKECFFVDVPQDCPLTITGFYYLSLDRATGAIGGFYFDSRSAPLQELQLQPVEYCADSPAPGIRPPAGAGAGGSSSGGEDTDADAVGSVGPAAGEGSCTGGREAPAGMAFGTYRLC
ncbi:hypothetical protein GPECTOR_9g742 [Gonium pectorale]|uniref:Fe2OG dioxygenase domain-containing protein n=1 Tax=Gonium pectorale TaxID=33097 RepID=A0A150GS65_GONPE|nr:hypothetical protein GPECTOR_9g742 [Gonium pectorale]|eukprot:KXZ52696.1 hypothetical protein GPECTOR_9g742 [Gonium pectorale]